MAILGFGKKKVTKKVSKATSKKVTVKPKKVTSKKVVPKQAKSSQANEAKAMLEKMAAKKASGDCPFC